jgi:uncharacterized protein
MKIVIAGGSGFIGKKLTKVLVQNGHQILILTRNERPSEGNISYVKWLGDGTSPESEIGEADAFINLAGVSINDGRWSISHQKRIYDSRMQATNELVRIIEKLPKKPSVLINASAIGIYPPSETTRYTEASIERANDFLAKTVSDWEHKAGKVEAYQIRPVFMRFGVVLGEEEGALPLMALPYKLFVGGTVGSGEQWVSWIHIQDVVRAIDFVITNERVHGPVNVTSPSPVKMKDFGRAIGSVLHRPHWFPVPAFVMKIVLGQKSSLVLEGQNVVPQVLINEGFKFNFPTINSALEGLLLKE